MIKNILTKNIFNIFIIVLITILIFKDCNNNVSINNKKDTLRVEQTTKIIDKVGTVIVNKPEPYKVQPYIITTKDTAYLPDTSYKGLLTQYKNIIDSFLSTKIYKKEYSLDSFGYVNVTDIIQNNSLQKQEVDWKIKIPSTTKIVTLKEPPRRILFIGGGIQGNSSILINQVNLGLAYKNKKDQILNLYVGASNHSNISYGANYYIPIKFRK